MAGDPADVGKAAIYASDVHSFASSPGFQFVNYAPDIRDVRVVGDWAFEWGLFQAEYRPSAGQPSKQMHGKLLRVLHREANGEWKFARISAIVDAE